MILDLVANSLNEHTVRARALRAWLLSAAWLGTILLLALLMGLFMVRGEASVASLLWLAYLAGVVAILYRPRYGLYLIIFLALVGDASLMPWYPFVKNFSSRESLLFVNDALVISPMESYLVLMLISWLGRGAIQRKIQFYVSDLFWPAMLFLGFAILGLIYGLGTGGNPNVGLWEIRPIFYLVLMMILTSNLLERREHVTNLVWAAMLALFVESLVGDWFFLVTLGASLGGVQAITEHGAAIHMNTMFLLAIALWIFDSTPARRLLLALASLVVMLTYIATQRRAAFLTLAIALPLMVIFIYRQNRRAFWVIVPAGGIIALAYIAVFWNNPGALGLPAQAVKSVIAEDQASAGDQASNIYREIENVNTGFTIHQHPLTGVGFGQKFYFIVPLPDISFFLWWEYMPHNSIIWIWLKMGVGGFVAMLYFVGMALLVGVRALLRMPRDEMSAIALVATLYVLMHFIYAYADISWDAQSMLYMGMMMGILASLERIVAQPVFPPPKRWPWQPDPVPPAGLLPIPDEVERG